MTVCSELHLENIALASQLKQWVSYIKINLVYDDYDYDCDYDCIQGRGWDACTPVELNTYNKQNNYTLCMHNSKDISNLQYYKCNMST